MLATYHNHSTWSDGQATLAQLLAAAGELNIGELGISDHWVLHPRGTQFKWAMPTDRLPQYVAEVISLREQAQRQAGPAICLGLEVDWFPGHSLPLRAELEKYNFDYLIGSVHQVTIPLIGDFMIDMSSTMWEKLTADQRNAVHRQYWTNVKSLAQSGLFDIIAHIDLPKKFGFYPTVDLGPQISEALDAIAAAPNQPVVELNTAGWHKRCADAYPSLDILRECRQRDIKVTLSADAHQSEHLLRDFARGAQRLAEAGYTHIARLDRRRVRLEPLEEAA